MCSVARGKTWAGRRLRQRGVGVERGLVRVGDLLGRLVLEPGRDEHPVLAAIEALVAEVADVGDVLDLEDVDAVVQDGPSDEVGEEECPEVADVGVAIDGRAAGVHPEAAPVGRFDGFDGAGQGVAEAERHRRIVVGRTAPSKFPGNRPNDSADVSLSGQRPRGNDIVPPAVW